ncbi:MAG TPA: histidine-type phosphatase [Terriglobia bacterium]|nr:histidine-type phosphatase [Terriglobia bacterium]
MNTKSYMQVLGSFVVLTALIPSALAKMPNRENEELRFTLILSRHGVRAPMASAIGYAAQPWPTWEVPPGQLTPHGAKALQQMGMYLRSDLAKRGLFPVVGCVQFAEVYLYSDTDARNIASSRATFEGFAPACDSLPIHTVDPKTLDPLFHAAAFFPHPVDGTNLGRSALPAEALNILAAESSTQLELLSCILAPDRAHQAEKSILGGTNHVASAPADILAANRLRSSASEIVQDLVLEYVDGKPMSQVGWGRVDEATLRRLIPIRITSFNLEKRPLAFAQVASSNLLFHILKTLDQASSGIATPGAFGSPSNRLVYISGHDGDLAGIGGLLGLHWIADGNKDDAPPDSQIAFELWQRPGSRRYTIRIRYRAQTLDQLRNASTLISSNPPAQFPVTPTGCTSSADCSFAVFRATALSRIDFRYVRSALDRSQIAP